MAVSLLQQYLYDATGIIFKTLLQVRPYHS